MNALWSSGKFTRLSHPRTRRYRGQTPLPGTVPASSSPLKAFTAEGAERAENKWGGPCQSATAHLEFLGVLGDLGGERVVEQRRFSR